MPRRVALEALVRANREARPVAEIARRLADRRKLADRDRDLARELAQGVYRVRSSLDVLLAARSKRPLERLDDEVLAALRLGAYQLVYLDRVPPRAALHATVEALKAGRSAHATGFVNAVLRGVASLVGEASGEPGDDPRRSLPRGDGSFVSLNEAVLPDPAEDLVGHLAARWAHPRWFVERLTADLEPAQVEQVLAAGLSRPILSLRPCAGHAEALEAALTESGRAFEREGPCLLVPDAGRVEALPGWDAGWFAVQGPTAAEVVPALDPKPGSGVLELCAAPGGKTLALAERLGPEGVVLAIDASETRLGRLRRELERRGIENVAVAEIDASDPDSLPGGLKDRDAEGFDAVLVDVPCSNSGVFGRRVEVRWRLEGPDRVIMLAEQAAHLLMVASTKVRPGGRLAYSTCSIDPVENQQVIRGLLKEDAEFGLVSERLTLPLGGRRDGGYHAILIRQG